MVGSSSYADRPKHSWALSTTYGGDQMFTKDQIITAQAKVKSGADYPNLIQDLKAIGVRSYDHIVSDHSNMFYSNNGHSVVISHSQPSIPVAAEPSSQ